MAILCGRITLPFISSSRHHLYRHHRRRSLFRHRTAAAAAESPADVSPKATLDTLSFCQQEQISLYVSTLLQWNQRMNLTAVTQESEVVTRHVEDSLAILPPLQRSYLSRCSGGSSSCDGLNIVDVGSGAGLPGLIFAIACPSWNVTLLESMHKRCLFLEHFIGLAGLSNVEILCERAENAGQCIDFRERFDVAVARAVAETRVLAEYCLPLVRVGGLFIAAKGSDPQVACQEIEKSASMGVA